MPLVCDVLGKGAARYLLSTVTDIRPLRVAMLQTLLLDPHILAVSQQYQIQVVGMMSRHGAIFVAAVVFGCPCLCRVSTMSTCTRMRPLKAAIHVAVVVSGSKCCRASTISAVTRMKPLRARSSQLSSL